jgi:COMPASS component SWD3
VHEDNASVTTVRFSPNGKYILAHTLDSCIRLWDYVSGTCKKTYQGHVNSKFSLGGTIGVSDGQAIIISGSEDGDILFWDITTKEILQRLTGVGHQGAVCWVDQSPEGGKVASCGLDGTVRVWRDVKDVNSVDGPMSGLRLEDGKGSGNGDDDTPKDTPEDEASVDGGPSPEKMEED